MFNASDRRERQQEARERLSELRARGYRYLVTQDDGASWMGSRSDGIEIESLLGSQFIGKVVVAHDDKTHEPSR